MRSASTQVSRSARPVVAIGLARFLQLALLFGLGSVALDQVGIFYLGLSTCMALGLVARLGLERDL
ncbi:MAG: hypothetical protein WED83_00675, partial [Acidimicrobiia bacterium]